MFRRLLLIVLVGSLTALIALNLDPVTTKPHKLVILCALAGIWCAPLILFWKTTVLRYSLLVIPILLLIPFLLPAGKTISPDELRKAYTGNMVSYENTRYHWGGESRRGIDCSGLPRKAIRDAVLAYGIRHLEGGALRIFLKHWWNDASAKALADGHLDFTVPLAESGTIATMNYVNLVPGDLAVTEDRRHILAYLGNDAWIQADPGAGKVIIENGRSSSNGWFAVPVTTHRWSVFIED